MTCAHQQEQIRCRRWRRGNRVWLCQAKQAGSTRGGAVVWCHTYYLALQAPGASIQQDVDGHMPGLRYTLRVSAAQRQNGPGGRNAIFKITADGVELLNEVIMSTSFEQRDVTYIASTS